MRYIAVLLGLVVGAWCQAATWKTEAPLPTVTFDAACALVDKKIWVSGTTEAGAAGKQSQVAYQYDLTTKAWANSTIGGPSRVAAGQIAIPNNGSIFIFGGYTTGGNSGVGKIVQSYGADQNGAVQWNANLPPNPKNVGSSAIGVVGQQFIVCGGYDDIAKGTSKECTIYNPANQSWTYGPNLTSPAQKACFGSDGTDLYIAGGRIGVLAETTKVTGAVQIASLTNVTQGPDNLPEPRSGMASTLVDGRLFCIGGEKNATATSGPDSGLNPNGTYARVDIYDTQLQAWSAGAPLPVGLHSACAITDGTTLFIIGGRTKTGGDAGTGSAAMYSIPIDALTSGAPVAVASAPVGVPVAGSRGVAGAPTGAVDLTAGAPGATPSAAGATKGAVKGVAAGAGAAAAGAGKAVKGVKSPSLVAPAPEESASPSSSAAGSGTRGAALDAGAPSEAGAPGPGGSPAADDKGSATSGRAIAAASLLLTVAAAALA